MDGGPGVVGSAEPTNLLGPTRSGPPAPEPPARAGRSAGLGATGRAGCSATASHPAGRHEGRRQERPPSEPPSPTHTGRRYAGRSPPRPAPPPSPWRQRSPAAPGRRTAEHRSAPSELNSGGDLPAPSARLVRPRPRGGSPPGEAPRLDSELGCWTTGAGPRDPGRGRIKVVWASATGNDPHGARWSLPGPPVEGLDAGGSFAAPEDVGPADLPAVLPADTQGPALPGQIPTAPRLKRRGVRRRGGWLPAGPLRRPRGAPGSSARRDGG